MPAKKTETPTPFQIWDETARTYSERLFEMTRRNIDQTLAMNEKISEMWIDAAAKTQALAVKQTEAALELAETTREQVKTASEKITRMMGEFSTN
jgi:hypothetical protein